MTHDFHYYITFMCARNAGKSFKESQEIAMCADAVDGGNPKLESEKGAKFANCTKGNFRPLTVYNEGSPVMRTRSLGGSIFAIPWMAFHFFPALSVKRQNLKVDGNDYSIKSSKAYEDIGNERGCLDQLKASLLLMNGLICTQNSPFAKKLIEDTAAKAGTQSKAFLGLRAHVIADLFAHEGFAGIRTPHIGALTNVDTLKRKSKPNEPLRLKYKMKFKPKAGSAHVRKHDISVFGHGQAGQRPDEPFAEFSFKRKLATGVTLTKDNKELFGRAMMAVTLVLSGKIQPSDYSTWAKWEDSKPEYIYKWKYIRTGMNRTRGKRLEYLRDLIASVELAKAAPGSRSSISNYDPGVHDGNDYWAFKQSGMPLKDFSDAADEHLNWFHKEFKKRTGVNIAQYLEASVLWPYIHSDDWHAVELNHYLINNPTEKKKVIGEQRLKVGGVQVAPGVGSFTGTRVSGYRGRVSGQQLGVHHMKEKHESIGKRTTLDRRGKYANSNKLPIEILKNMI